MPLREKPGPSQAPEFFGPGSAAHSYALRCVRVTPNKGNFEPRDSSRAASTMKTIDYILWEVLMFVRRHLKTSLFAALSLMAASPSFADSAVRTDPAAAGLSPTGLARIDAYIKNEI